MLIVIARQLLGSRHRPTVAETAVCIHCERGARRNRVDLLAAHQKRSANLRGANARGPATIPLVRHHHDWSVQGSFFSPRRLRKYWTMTPSTFSGVFSADRSPGSDAADSRQFLPHIRALLVLTMPSATWSGLTDQGSAAVRRSSRRSRSDSRHRTRFLVVIDRTRARVLRREGSVARSSNVWLERGVGLVGLCARCVCGARLVLFVTVRSEICQACICRPIPLSIAQLRRQFWQRLSFLRCGR